MDLKEEANKAIAKLGQALNLKEPLVLDEEGACFVFLDEKLLFLLEFNDESSSIVINLVIGKLPETDAGPILYDMMTANFFWNRTAGGTLGVDEMTNIIGLCYAVPLPLDNDDDLEQVIEQLAKAGDYWLKKLDLKMPEPKELGKAGASAVWP